MAKETCHSDRPKGVAVRLYGMLLSGNTMICYPMPHQLTHRLQDLKAEDAKSAADARQKLNQALAQREDEIYQKSTVVVQHPPSKKKTPAPWARHLPVNRASSPPGRKLYQPKHPRSDDPPKAEKAVRKRLKLNPNPLMVMAMSRPKTASSSSGGNPAAPSSSRGRPSTLPPARAATDRTAPRSIPEAAPRRTIPRLDSSSSGGTPPSISPGRSDGHPTASVNKQISPSASDSSAGAKKPKSMTFDKKPAEALSNGSAPGSPPSKNLPMLIRYRKVEIKKVVRKSKVS